MTCSEVYQPFSITHDMLVSSCLCYKLTRMYFYSQTIVNIYYCTIWLNLSHFYYIVYWRWGHYGCQPSCKLLDSSAFCCWSGCLTLIDVGHIFVQNFEKQGFILKIMHKFCFFKKKNKKNKKTWTHFYFTLKF